MQGYRFSLHRNQFTLHAKKSVQALRLSYWLSLAGLKICAVQGPGQGWLNDTPTPSPGQLPLEGLSGHQEAVLSFWSCSLTWQCFASRPGIYLEAIYEWLRILHCCKNWLLILYQPFWYMIFCFSMLEWRVNWMRPEEGAEAPVSWGFGGWIIIHLIVFTMYLPWARHSFGY